MTRSGWASELPTPALPTAGSGCSSSPGLLPTPDAALALGGHTHRGGARSDEPLLPGVALALLRTPTAQLAVNGGSQHPDKRKAGGHGPTLADEVEHLLPTPLAGDGRHGGPGQTHGQGGPSLSAAAALLPTPTVQESHRSLWVDDRDRDGNPGKMLTSAIGALLPTPVVNDMGEGKTVERWDEWTQEIKARHGNGNGHGASLAIEAQRGADRWGAYADAVHRWEQATGAPAPAATEPGKHGQPRLSAPFVEWMMGLPPGHVTDVPGVGRNAQLKALGNGVVPQQAALGVAAILANLPPAALTRLR